MLGREEQCCEAPAGHRQHSHMPETNNNIRLDFARLDKRTLYLKQTQHRPTVDLLLLAVAGDLVWRAGLTCLVMKPSVMLCPAVPSMPAPLLLAAEVADALQLTSVAKSFKACTV